MSARVLPDVFGVMAVDPGGTTGVALGMFNVKRVLEADGDVTMRGLLARASERRAIRYEQISGTPTEQAEEIKGIWDGFGVGWTFGLGMTGPLFLVVESFALRQRSANLSPVEIRAVMDALGLRWDDQSPSEAKGYATNARLREWGVWARGMEHARDATRHLCVKVAKIIE